MHGPGSETDVFRDCRVETKAEHEHGGNSAQDREGFGDLELNIHDAGMVPGEPRRGNVDGRASFPLSTGVDRCARECGGWQTTLLPPGS